MIMWHVERAVVRSKELKVIDDPKEAIDQIKQLGFDRIATLIGDSWSTYQLKDYFKELILPSRENREGFPPAVFSLILKLSILHDKLYPKEIIDRSWQHEKE